MRRGLGEPFTQTSGNSRRSHVVPDHMKHENSHLADQQLLLDVDGELSPQDEKLVRRHLDACWKCRVRHRELENAITRFIRVYQRESDSNLPPADGPRALLKAQLAQLSETGASPGPSWFTFQHGMAWAPAAAVSGLLTFGLFLIRSNDARRTQARHCAMVASIPDSNLTPGAPLMVNKEAVCAQANTKNKAVFVALQRKVFEEYGITGAEPQACEVDYLVTPALGGADDIHNPWPHSCDGTVDLTEAQHEIATNWIAAYKNSFRTEGPLEEHSESDHRKRVQ
jgi:hypothetical protein